MAEEKTSDDAGQKQQDGLFTFKTPGIIVKSAQKDGVAAASSPDQNHAARHVAFVRPEEVLSMENNGARARSRDKERISDSESEDT